MMSAMNTILFREHAILSNQWGLCFHARNERIAGGVRLPE